MLQSLADHLELFRILFRNYKLMIAQYSLAESCVLSNHLEVLDDKAFNDRLSLHLVQFGIIDGIEEFIVVWLIILQNGLFRHFHDTLVQFIGVTHLFGSRVEVQGLWHCLQE